MFKNLAYKKKINYLVIGSIILLIATYSLSIKKTLGEIKKKHQYEEQLEAIKEAPKEISVLRQRLDKYQNIIGSNSGVDSDPQEIILEHVSNYCTDNDIIIRTFPKPFVYHKSNYVIETYSLLLDAGFHDLLGLVHYIEKEVTIGKITSVDFFLKRDYKLQKDRLNMTLYFQTIKTKKDEN